MALGSHISPFEVPPSELTHRNLLRLRTAPEMGHRNFAVSWSHWTALAKPPADLSQFWRPAAVSERPNHGERLLEGKKALTPHQGEYPVISCSQIFFFLHKVFSSSSTLPITKSLSFTKEHKLDKRHINRRQKGLSTHSAHNYVTPTTHLLGLWAFIAGKKTVSWPS